MTIDGFSIQHLSTKPERSLVQAMAEAGPKEDVGDTLANAYLEVFSAKVADVRNAAVESAPCSKDFQTLGGWRPSMRPGRTPG